MQTTTWPSLPLATWRPTRDTLHRYAQIVGKIQLARTPVVNHFWNVTLRVTARGIATNALPCDGRTFDIELDLISHHVVVRTSDGSLEVFDMRRMPVADFYAQLMAALDALGIQVHVWDHPVEIRDGEVLRFSQDRVHAAYDQDAVERYFKILRHAAELLEQFRARFIGKSSGVGLYWGTLDLTVASYSGRRAPDAPVSGTVEREAYSHEVSEAGFWPGDSSYPAPAFFALHYPQPDGYADGRIEPREAHWHEPAHCFVLPYEDIRADHASEKILEFCQSTYALGADLAHWDREELERHDQG